MPLPNKIAPLWWRYLIYNPELCQILLNIDLASEISETVFENNLLDSLGKKGIIPFLWKKIFCITPKNPRNDSQWFFSKMGTMSFKMVFCRGYSEIKSIELISKNLISLRWIVRMSYFQQRKSQAKLTIPFEQTKSTKLFDYKSYNQAPFHVKYYDTKLQQKCY